MNISKNYLLPLLTLSLFIGCSPTSQKSRFKTTNRNDEITIIDTKTKLEWVNGSEFKEFDGCKGFPKKPTNTHAFIKKSVVEHCKSLTFAGHNNWRVPTATENQRFIIATKSANITPYYTIKACPKVIGIQGRKVVSINTHNTKPIGEINSWVDGTNGGVRCVREIK